MPAHWLLCQLGNHASPKWHQPHRINIRGKEGKMKFEDTVMPGHYSPEEFTRLNKQAAVTWDIAYKAGRESLAKSIGPIAYDVGKQAGMKEVVEWSDEKCPHDIQELSQSGLVTRNEMPEKKCECPLCWQAFLVEKELR